MSDEFLSPVKVTGDLDLDLYNAFKDIDDLGFAVYVKQGDSTRATTIYGMVFLPATFDDKEQIDQLGMIRHETVHVRQWLKYGPTWVFGYTMVPELTFIYEAQGHRQSIRDFVDSGYDSPPEDLLDWIIDKADKFPKNYVPLAGQREEISDAFLYVLTTEYANYSDRY